MAVVCFTIASAAFISPSSAHDLPATQPTTEELAHASAEMAAAATNLWNSLSPEQQKSIAFDFKDDERFNYHYIPRPRKGLPWADMKPAQRHLASALLASGLSTRGYSNVVSVMSLEDVLAVIEQGKGPVRDAEKYYFSIFGTPGPKGMWGWRLEGHHLAFNFTIVDGVGIAASPAFLGSNPGEVPDGPRKGMRILADEEDLGFRFVNGLDDAQKKKAILSAEAPKEIVSSNQRKFDPGAPAGIGYAELRVEQQAMLRILVNLYAHRLRDELAHQDLAAIEAAGWDKVFFSWAGGTQTGVGHYYRIQGAGFVIEFDNTQNNANHIHTVWRDLKNDFGEDLLKKHYAEDHAGAK